MGSRQLDIDGGSVAYLVDGPADAPDLLQFHLGTPCAAVPFDGLTRAAAAAGMQTPGYGNSTRLARPLRQRCRAHALGTPGR